MYSGKRILSALTVAATLCVAGVSLKAHAAPTRFAKNSAQQAASPAPSRPIGTIQSIVGNLIILETDAGATVDVVIGDATRILRIAPGQKDLSHAQTIHAQDLQVGDRILASGLMSGDGKSVAATIVIVMTKSDLQAKQAQERAAWQNGAGGLVKSVDPASGTIIVNVAVLGGNKTVTIHTTNQTILRRYAPDSVKFDDAQPGTMEQIRPGDQLRARGTFTASGTEFQAQEIVSGSFRNIAGTVISVDPKANTVRVMDLIMKKPVLVKFTADSQLHKLPPMMARGIAMRLRMAANGQQQFANRRGETTRNRTSNGAPGGPRRFQRGLGGATGNLQQMLDRLPPLPVAKLQKGDAVMIVSTEGSVRDEVTAIKLLVGVEPILEAAPKGKPGMVLSPWNMSAPSGGENN